MRDFISSAPHLGVGYGEVVFSDGTHSSQIDVIVYDRKVKQADYRCAGIVVVPVEAVKLIVEVKGVFPLAHGLSEELEKTRNVFLRIRESAASVQFLCIHLEGHTLDDPRLRKGNLRKRGIDNFFALSTRSGTVVGELARFAESIRALCL